MNASSLLMWNALKYFSRKMFGFWLEVYFVLFSSDFCCIGLATSCVPACSQSLAVLFCDPRQWLLKSSFPLSSIVCTQPAPVIQRKILKCQQLVIITSQTDCPHTICVYFLLEWVVCLSWEDSILKMPFFFLISLGIARVYAIDLYKLVSNRKGSKLCMLAFNFPIAVEYCPNFLNCGFQDYRVTNEAFVQVMVQIYGSGRVNPP